MDNPKASPTQQETRMMEEDNGEKQEEALTTVELDDDTKSIFSLFDSSIEPLPSPSPSPPTKPSQPGAFACTVAMPGSVAARTIDDTSSIIRSHHLPQVNVDLTPRTPGEEEMAAVDLGLVEAQPVGVAEEAPPKALAHALPVDQAEEEARKEELRSKREERVSSSRQMMLLVVCFLISVLLAGIFSSQSDSSVSTAGTTNNSSKSSNVTATNPSSTITGLVLDLPLDLPNTTLFTIYQDAEGTSPQYKAYRWLQNDPYLADYSEQPGRLLQRFAVVTLYFASVGDEWTHQGGGTVSIFDSSLAPNNQQGTGSGGLGGGNSSSKGTGGRAHGLSSPQDTQIGDIDNSGSGSSNGGGGNGGGGSGGSGETGGVTGVDAVVGNLRRLQPPLSLSLGGGPAASGSGTSVGNRSEQSDRNVSFSVTSEPWLSYESSECDWFSTAQLLSKSACVDGRFRYLGLLNNNLQGTMPIELELLTSLETIHFGRNKIEGTVPSHLASLRNLRQFLAERNDLTGTIPSEIGLLASSLQEFVVEDNFLTSEIPSDFWKLTGMRKLWLQRNQLTGTLPPDIGYRMPDLFGFSADSNGFIGSIPSSFGLCSNLIALNVQMNQISGPLPSDLGNLTRLRSLRFGDNHISGSLPSQLAGLTSLMHLSLSGNTNMEGSFPPELGQLNATLKILHLDRTSITGTIPAELCGTESLRFDCSITLCGCGCSCTE